MSEPGPPSQRWIVQPPADHLRFMPPEARAALKGTACADESAQGNGAAMLDAGSGTDRIPPHSRTHRIIHSAAWKHVVAWVSVLALLWLIGNMCSPVYWRF